MIESRSNGHRKERGEKARKPGPATSNPWLICGVPSSPLR